MGELQVIEKTAATCVSCGDAMVRAVHAEKSEDGAVVEARVRLCVPCHNHKHMGAGRGPRLAKAEAVEPKPKKGKKPVEKAEPQGDPTEPKPEEGGE